MILRRLAPVLNTCLCLQHLAVVSLNHVMYFKQCGHVSGSGWIDSSCALDVFFLLKALNFMRLLEKWWQCVMQEMGEPVASGPSDQKGIRNVLLQSFGPIPLYGLLCGAVVGRGHSFSRENS